MTFQDEMNNVLCCELMGLARVNALITWFGKFRTQNPKEWITATQEPDFGEHKSLEDLAQKYADQAELELFEQQYMQDVRNKMQGL